MDTTWAQNEMQGAQIGDQRNRQNLVKLCTALAVQPGIAFSRAAGESLRKSAHRLFGQHSTTPQGLLEGHFQQSAQRCHERQLPLVLALSDTTTMDFTSHPKTRGLGPITTTAHCQGFLTHSVLASTVEGLPLGLLHQEHWVRPPAKEGPALPRSKQHKEKAHEAQKKRAFCQKESFKWVEALRAVEQALPPEQPVLLIQDREADIFAFLAAPRRENTHLLIRAAQPRRVCVVTASPPDTAQNTSAPCQNLFAALETSPIARIDTIQVGRRPDEAARAVTLAISYLPVRVLPPVRQGRARRLDDCPLVWLLQAREVARDGAGQWNPTPKGLHWVLLCTLPIRDAEHAATVIQYYARRWQIERFHFVLKSGCQVEKLQMDRALSLMKALSLYSVVAWWLLYLTHLARVAPATPADQVMEEGVLELVCAGERRPVETVSELVLAVARVGGFRRLPSAPDPGVKSLWLGLRRLYERYQGWQLALQRIEKQARNAGQD